MTCAPTSTDGPGRVTTVLQAFGLRAFRRPLGAPGFATIGWWNAQKAAELSGKLQAIQEGEAGNALDNTVITFASGMHGGNHDAGNLPLALIGGGGKTARGTVLKTDRHVAFASEQRLADVHLTVLQKVFGCDDKVFGASSGIITDLLA